MHYHFRFHTAPEGGYWAEGIELPGCVTQAETRAALEANLRASLMLYLSEPPDSELLFPEPRKGVRGAEVMRVPVPASLAFAIRLRQARLTRGLSQRAMAERLDFAHVSAYQKLERPTANPTLKTLARIKETLPDLELDTVLST
ncbi:MAG: helix-turn-helix domain-containing protein [Polyangiales bacterium]